MAESTDVLNQWAPGLAAALRQAGICSVATLDDGTGVIVRCAYPRNTDWTLWDNGDEMGVLRVNDATDRAVFFPFTGLRGQRLDAMTLLSRIWSAIRGEPIDYAFNYAERAQAIDTPRTGEAE